VEDILSFYYSWIHQVGDVHSPASGLLNGPRLVLAEVVTTQRISAIYTQSDNEIDDEVYSSQ